MKCPYCDGLAAFVPNEDIYGKRYGASFMVWWCRDCDAYVGTHHNDPDRPLGTMANAALRLARRGAHRAIDHAWKSGRLKRGQVYARLAAHFGRTIHIGESDEETCRLVVEANVAGVLDP